MISGHAPLPSSYDYGEVARSVLIAVAASYVALDLAGRVTTAKGSVRPVWLGGGAFAMGVGIWAMHFKGMLAFHLPVPVKYHWPTVLASLVLSILASALALYIVSRHKMGWVEASIGGAIMSVAIAGMHYVGMAAMRLPATTQYSSLLVTLSILLAIAFSLLALLMAFDLREETRWTVPRRLGSAIVMGAAVSGMHYTGMAAASFWPGPPPDLSMALSVSAVGNNAIGIVALTLILAAMVTSSVDRRTNVEFGRINQELEQRVAERTRELAVSNESLRTEIAERGRAEEAVRRSQEYLRLVIDTLPAMVWRKLPDGSADFLNERFRQYTGLSLEQGLGWGWMINAFHPEDRAQEEWRKAFAAGRPFEREARIRGADGKYRWFLLRAEPLCNEPGRVVCWYGISTDIDDRKRAEEALLEAQDKLARTGRTQALAQLAATIAHEVNQPLTAIVTNANFSLRQLANPVPNHEELREALTEVAKDANRASAVISHIRGLLVKEPAPRREVDINDIVQQVVALLRNELTRNRVLVSPDLTPELLLVQADPIQLQQVLINLLMNAVEAMQENPEQRRKILIKTARHADGVWVQVQDSGPGIAPSTRARIFEPFFSTKSEGIGMGLSISHSIIESHGGQLQASMPERGGATFEFTLPTDGAGES